MSWLSRQDPTGRFTGLAALYDQCRPSYPQTAVDYIVKRCGLQKDSLLVDVGCGTGISARLFAGRGVRVIGLEPNADMRKRAEEQAARAGVPVPVYRDGRAEATGLPDACADVVLAAQAFHWFQQQEALREFHRILKPAGWAVLVWNERDETDSFTAAVGKLIQALPEAQTIEARHGQGEALLASPLFQDGEQLHFEHEQTVDEDGLLGRAFSLSYAPHQEEGAEAFAAALRKVFARYQHDGRVVLRYQTTAFLARWRAADLEIVAE